MDIKCSDTQIVTISKALLDKSEKLKAPGHYFPFPSQTLINMVRSCEKPDLYPPSKEEKALILDYFTDMEDNFKDPAEEEEKKRL